MRCTANCKQITFFQAYTIPIVAGGSGMVLFGIGALIYYRKKIADFFRSLRKNTDLSIDDIPLDELEMPWHKT